jgi:hypothetical protein
VLWHLAGGVPQFIRTIRSCFVYCFCNGSWLDKWNIYKQKTAQETQFDPKSGDMLGSKTVKLLRPGLLVEHQEDGATLAGGIIYWNGKKYVWIHQGE